MSQQGYVMDVRVPEGATPGQSMLVAAPTGEQVRVEIPDYATPGSTIAVSVPAGPGSGSSPGPVHAQDFGGAGDDDLARAIQASLQDTGGAPMVAPAAVAPAEPGGSGGDQVAAASREAIQMGFPEDQVARVQGSRAFTSTAVLIEYLVSGGDTEDTSQRSAGPPTYSPPIAVPTPQPTAAQWGAQTADAAIAAGNSPSAADLMEEERQLEMAMRASLAMVAGGGGGGDSGTTGPARRSEPGSEMDPSHTFRSLVIEMLRGDASARQDLVKAFDDLNRGHTFQSPRLLYFLLENCKMEKLSKLPENIVTLWMGYLQRAPPQPALRDLIVIEGQLGKQGSKKWDTKGFKMKWFVMTDSFLCYYNKLSDKQDGKEPRKQIPLSAVIRLQMVGADVSGMQCSFEIVTEQDHPNWKVHAAISDDEGESQLYYFKWQSAIEEAVRGARDLDLAFVNAKSSGYWADVDAKLQTSGPDTRSEEPRLAPPTHQRQASATSQADSDGFDPREQLVVEVEAPTSQEYDPFAVDTPKETPAPDLISELLGADTTGGLAKQVSSTDPFASINWGNPAPAPSPASPAPIAAMQPVEAPAPAQVTMPVMTPSPLQASTAAAASPLPVSSVTMPMQPGAASNPFRPNASANPFGPSSPPTVSPPMGITPAQPQNSGNLVAAQARGVDGSINGNLFDTHAAKAPVTNPFAPGGGNPDALAGLRAAARPIPGPTSASQTNPFAKLENDAWSKAAAKSPLQAATSSPAVTKTAPAPEPEPAKAAPSPWDAVGAAPAQPHQAATPVMQEAPPSVAVGSTGAATGVAAASPWDSVGTTSGNPTPVMPAEPAEMQQAAAAKAASNNPSDLI